METLIPAYINYWATTFWISFITLIMQSIACKWHLMNRWMANLPPDGMFISTEKLTNIPRQLRNHVWPQWDSRIKPLRKLFTKLKRFICFHGAKTQTRTFSLSFNSAKFWLISVCQSFCIVRNDSCSVAMKFEFWIFSSALIILENGGRSWGSWLQQTATNWRN